MVVPVLLGFDACGETDSYSLVTLLCLWKEKSHQLKQQQGSGLSKVRWILVLIALGRMLKGHSMKVLGIYGTCKKEVGKLRHWKKEGNVDVRRWIRVCRCTVTRELWTLCSDSHE